MKLILDLRASRKQKKCCSARFVALDLVDMIREVDKMFAGWACDKRSLL